MATRKQRTTNRRSAQLSTGPQAPEGKAGPLETALVDQVVMAQWRIARLHRMETRRPPAALPASACQNQFCRTKPNRPRDGTQPLAAE